MFYAKSCFAIGGERFLPDAEELLAGFEEEIQTSCIGSISECFEGDPPFRAKGCLSQATSVGGLLYISNMVSSWRNKLKRAKKSAQGTEPKAKKCVSRKK